MKSFVRWAWLIVVMALVFTPKVSAQSKHRVLLMGDSLTAVTLNNWHKMISYDHLVVAKGGQTTSWLLDQIGLLIASDEINKYDTAVVWIGVNDPQKAVKEIPEIYKILRSYDIKIIGVTQWFHYCSLDQTMKENIVVFDEIVRKQADLVLDFAVDPNFVDNRGYINQNAAADCVHMNQNTMAEIVSSAVNNAIMELYRPTPTPIPTQTPTRRVLVGL